MKKTLITTGIFALLIGLSGCLGDSGPTVDINEEYKSDQLGITLDLPETFTVEEAGNSLTIYHFKDQPVPYFVINVSEKGLEATLSDANIEIIEREEMEFNKMDATRIRALNEALGENVDYYYIENNGKTYSFSCLNGLYDDICREIEIANL